MLPRVQFSSAPWQRERVQRLARISRCLDRGRAKGKRLHEMLVWFAWKWKGRRYISEPGRRIQFSCGTLNRLYLRWRVSGGKTAALANRYRPPVKLRKSHVLDFARSCINTPSRSFAEAYGRLPRPRATVFAYRLHLGPKLLRRITRLFAARRTVDVRCRWARAAVNSFATEGAK